MTRDDRAAPPTEAELVAYLDGELSPADSVRIGQQLAVDTRIAARVEHLMKGGRSFRESFAPLLAEAPLDKLGATLDQALARPAPGAAPRPRLAAAWPATAVAAVALIGVGIGADRLIVTPLEKVVTATSARPDTSDDWRRAVARYLALYTRGTLEAIPDGAAGDLALADVGRQLGLPLTPPRVDLPALALKRADVYDYDGKPLAFLAYLGPRNGPVALCITEGQGDDALRNEVRRGMNVVYWSQGEHRFMLIGQVPSGDLQALATTLASHLAPKDRSDG